jgi:hypothetical protein
MDAKSSVEFKVGNKYSSKLAFAQSSSLQNICRFTASVLVEYYGVNSFCRSCT